MEKTRTPVGAAGWLWVTVAVAAMGFSLVHTLVDFALITLGSGFTLESGFSVQQSLLSVLIGLLYTWWAWVFAKAVGGTKSWLVGLMAFDVLWVGGNGLTILACLPPCGSVPFFADALHVGNLILAPLAAYYAYRAMRRISGPGSWLVMVGNIIIMLAFVIAIVAVLASLSNA
jgi:hypothetical protein